MATRMELVVHDAAGVSGTIREFTSDAMTTHALVELADGSHVEVPSEALHRVADGGFTIDTLWRSFPMRHRAWASVPVVQESVSVSVKAVAREQVRVRRRVVEETRLVETPVERQRLEIERVAIGCYVTEAPAARQDGEVLIVPVVDEVVFVEKRLLLREEIRIRTVREQVIDRQTVVLRRHEVDIAREAAPAASAPGDSIKPNSE